MDEHENMNFEHELSERFKALDENIKIPEIPDAQGIFELAEKETKVVPFSKIKRYAAVAAAVVLICVSIPVVLGSVGGVSMDMAANEAAEEPRAVQNESLMDAAFDEPVEAFVEEETEEPSAAPKDGFDEAATETVLEDEEQQKSISGSDGNVNSALEEFFRENSTTASGNPSTGGNDGDDITSVAVDSFGADLNKKREIEVSVEKDSVSVILRDKAADSEVISAFWVEGTFIGSGEEDDYYVINLAKKITEEDFESGNWLPMAGDAEKGTYFIDESSVEVGKKINSGNMNIRVAVHIGTGDYEITAKIF